MSVILSNLRTVLSFQVFLFLFLKKKWSWQISCVRYRIYLYRRSKMFGLKMSNRAKMAAECGDLDELKKELLKPYVLYHEMNL